MMRDRKPRISVAAGAPLRGSLCALVLALTSCSSTSASDRSKAGEQAAEQPRPVQTVTVEERALGRSVLATGTLAADEQVVVGSEVAGRIASMPVDIGSVVKKGQVLAQLDPSDYQLRVEQAASGVAQARALLGLPPTGDDDKVEIDTSTQVKQARATLDEAKANLERSKTLLEKRLVAQAELDAAQATFLRAESGLSAAREEMFQRQAALRQRRSELMLARKQLADATIRAPLDGTVQERHVSMGEFVTMGARIATIVRVNPLRLRVEVPEREAGSVRPGQEVSLTVEGDETHYKGKVARVSPMLNTQNRALVVESEIENPGTLRAGSFARAEIAVDPESKALAVPTKSIVVFAGIEKVLEVRKGVIEEHVITTGRRANGYTEVLKGVEAGVPIVETPANLQHGQAVRVVAGEGR
jgi:RND family efflux transporter MFP subunit